MLREENDCCGCGLPCLGEGCSLRHVLHVYCDVCGEEMSFKSEYLHSNTHVCEHCEKEVII